MSLEPDENTINWCKTQKQKKVNAQDALTELLRVNGNPRQVVPLCAAIRQVYGTSMEGVLGMLRVSRQVLQDHPLSEPLRTADNTVPKPKATQKPNYFRKRTVEA